MQPDDPEAPSSGSVEQYWAICRRRRWWICLPLFLCWGLVWVASWFLPTTYRSEALILVEQQRVPEQYVVPNVTFSLQDRLQNMTEQILSRTRLQETIDHFGLYRKRGALLSTDDAVDQMRKDIKIDLVEAPGHPGELTAFKIDYSARSRELAQSVNSELTSLFIEENLKSQQQQSENTTAFLGQQLEAARSQLQEQEAKMTAFKAKHLGDLPSQLETNVQILSGLQNQLDDNQRALDGAKQHRLYLDSLFQQYQALNVVGTGADDTTSPEALKKELLDLRAKLADARSRYTEDFPDVVALKEKIEATEQLEQQLENEMAASQKKIQEAGVDTNEGPNDGSSAAMMEVRSELKANDLEVQNYEHRATELEAQVGAYRARLNMTPQTEQELEDISRGYDESKANYASLLQKQNQSELATSLEQQQQGQQFRIIDPPSLPDKPASPNHLLISLAGLTIGGVLGIGLAAYIEFSNLRVWHEKDLEGLVPSRILVSIPQLSITGPNRLQPAIHWLELGAGLGMTFLIIAGNLYAFLKG